MIYFNEGNVVKVKHLPNSPKMVVKTVNKTQAIKEGEKPTLLGVTCYWFANDNSYQEARFNTKDLEKEITYEAIEQPKVTVKKINKIEHI